MKTNKIYQDFLSNKAFKDIPTGFSLEVPHEKLYDFQKDIVNWASLRGRACLFEDCGLGKTPQQLVWADNIRRKKGDVLILAPIAVSSQTVKEGKKFGIDLEYSRTGEKSKTGITITNYEMLSHFCPDDYAGIVLDESSILKSFTGKIRTEIIELFSQTPFKLACTATPSPNDLMELGNHAEFVGAMTRSEMLSMFFVHDGGETQKWRLKRHSQYDFWKWVCSWAVMLRKPSDLGYKDDSFILPPLNMHEIIVDVDHTTAQNNLFLMDAITLQERQQARRNSVKERCQMAAIIANSSDEPCLIWCDRNCESELLGKLINDSKQIRGSDSYTYKENTMLGFTDGNVKRLITKPTIAGFGMNWQHCCKVLFVGLSDSYEQFYQAIRRCWRFGQTKPVDCYIITSSIEGAVVANIKRKEAQSNEMAIGMAQNMHVYNEENIKGTQKNINFYKPNLTMKMPNFMRGN